MLTSFAIFLLNEALKKAKQMDQKSLIRTRTISHKTSLLHAPLLGERKFSLTTLPFSLVVLLLLSCVKMYWSVIEYLSQSWWVRILGMLDWIFNYDCKKGGRAFEVWGVLFNPFYLLERAWFWAALSLAEPCWNLRGLAGAYKWLTRTRKVLLEFIKTYFYYDALELTKLMLD